ncbi:MAG TPA: hypothetical protein VFR37_22100, partial [Longimicrobium sp.]|nr:hypothetical protein [Longimicrobium sp.]
RLLLLALFRLESGAPAASREALRELKSATAGADLPFFVGRAHAMGLLPEHVTLADAQQLLRHLQARSRAIVAYVPGPLPTPAHLFLTQDPDADLHRGWKGTPASASIQVVPVPGTHQSMLSPGNVEVLGTAMSCAIRTPAHGPNGRSG